MARNDVVLGSSPPSLTAVQQNTLPQQELSGNDVGTASDGLNSGIIITVLVIATAVIVSAVIYLLLRCISFHFRRRRYSSDPVQVATGRVAPEESSLIESLPLFTFASITGGKAIGAGNGADCAVCLSKFEPQDKLRLLPVCCHAFHAECIDIWLATNQTCPLCRSSINVSDSELMSKIADPAPNSADRSGSFRIEIGNVSRHRQSTDSDRRRSYSIGSFDYIVNDLASEVTVPSNRAGPEFSGGGTKIYVSAPPGETLTPEIGGRGSWLKDYVDRLTWTASLSLSSSLRSSGRFFTGSSRRTANDSDLEASRLGDEIGEMFRWLSGV